MFYKYYSCIFCKCFQLLKYKVNYQHKVIKTTLNKLVEGNNSEKQDWSWKMLH